MNLLSSAMVLCIPKFEYIRRIVSFTSEKRGAAMLKSAEFSRTNGMALSAHANFAAGWMS